MARDARIRAKRLLTETNPMMRTRRVITNGNEKLTRSLQIEAGGKETRETLIERDDQKCDSTVRSCIRGRIAIESIAAISIHPRDSIPLAEFDWKFSADWRRSKEAHYRRLIVAYRRALFSISRDDRSDWSRSFPARCFAMKTRNGELDDLAFFLQNGRRCRDSLSLSLSLCNLCR